MRVLTWTAMSWTLVGLAWAWNLGLPGLLTLGMTTAGHVFSYYQRHRPTGLTRTLVLSALMVGAFF